MESTRRHLRGMGFVPGFGPGRKGARRAAAIMGGMALLALPGLAEAASSDSCAGGGFTVSGPGFSVAGDGEHVIPAANLGGPIRVVGRYVEYTVVPASFGIRDWLFTGAPNPEDITGGRRTQVWQEKTPDHRGLTLTGNVTVELDEEEIVLQRSGVGLTMKIQSKDCAQGGIFQMEPERGDQTRTRITHVLAPEAFYFDNPNFRAREGDRVRYDPGQDGIDVQFLTVPSRINVGNDLSAKFVGRDSGQVATRVEEPSCVNLIRKRDNSTETVRHCGRVSRWDVASGGRMGWVTGEDAVEVAPPSTNCTRRCQAQNRVRGGAVVLGFPFPVPADSRLKPPFPAP